MAAGTYLWFSNHSLNLLCNTFLYFIFINISYCNVTYLLGAYVLHSTMSKCSKMSTILPGVCKGNKVCCSCGFRWDTGWRSEKCPPFVGAGAQNALWLQLWPSASSAAPWRQTDHSGAGPSHSRSWRGNHPGGWLQAIPGTVRTLNQNMIKISLKDNSLLLTFPNLLSSRFLPSSAEAIPTLNSFSDGINLVLMDHDSQQYLLDLLALEREELLCPSGCTVLLNRGIKEPMISEESWITPEEESIPTASKQSIHLWWRFFTGREVQRKSAMAKFS